MLFEIMLVVIGAAIATLYTLHECKVAYHQGRCDAFEEVLTMIQEEI